MRMRLEDRRSVSHSELSNNAAQHMAVPGLRKAQMAILNLLLRSSHTLSEQLWNLISQVSLLYGLA